MACIQEDQSLPCSCLPTCPIPCLGGLLATAHALFSLLCPVALTSWMIEDYSTRREEKSQRPMLVQAKGLEGKNKNLGRGSHCDDARLHA